MRQLHGSNLDLDLDMDALLLEDLDFARCTAAPRPLRDRDACADDADAPWWVGNSAEPGCLFQRPPRHAA